MENRVRKYRVWDKKRKEMVYFDFELLNSESTAFYEEQIKGNPQMDYIEVDDIHDNQIYEGDLVADRRRRGILFEITFCYRRCGYVGRCTKGIYGLDIHSRVEVVGNIFENPELAKSVKKC